MKTIVSLVFVALAIISVSAQQPFIVLDRPSSALDINDNSQDRIIQYGWADAGLYSVTHVEIVAYLDNVEHHTILVTNAANGFVKWTPRTYLDKSENYFIAVRWMSSMFGGIEAAWTRTGNIKVHLAGKDRVVNVTGCSTSNGMLQLQWVSTNLPNNAIMRVVVPNPNTPGGEGSYLAQSIPNTGVCELVLPAITSGAQSVYLYYQNEYGLLCQFDTDSFLVP